VKTLTSLCHSNSTINDGDGIAGLVRDNMNEQLRLCLKLCLVSQAIKTDFVQSLFFIFLFKVNTNILGSNY
jgi:hypothetical protein